ncbi:MAG TPA: hypothetical protein VD833_18355 [Vicinamibacterales bacterium]|nr:hypothetical protein [Vicinamibacterales bacterium]
MADKSSRPKPHGDPLQEVVEDNRAQQESDAPPDATVDPETSRGFEEKGHDNTAHSRND